jgi:hypothetical protein
VRRQQDSDSSEGTHEDEEPAPSADASEGPSITSQETNEVELGSGERNLLLSAIAKQQQGGNGACQPLAPDSKLGQGSASRLNTTAATQKQQEDDIGGGSRQQQEQQQQQQQQQQKKKYVIAGTAEADSSSSDDEGDVKERLNSLLRSLRREHECLLAVHTQWRYYDRLVGQGNHSSNIATGAPTWLNPMTWVVSESSLWISMVPGQHLHCCWSMQRAAQ